MFGPGIARLFSLFLIAVSPQNPIDQRNQDAEDDCGNYFVVLNSEICFWDHETREVRMLAKSTDDFIKSLHVRDVISLDNVQIRSAWIDPEFAAQLKK